MTGDPPADPPAGPPIGAGLRTWRSARRTVIERYEDLLERHGPTAQGMEWKDAESQRLRFRLLSEVGALDGRTVHELGAGAGHLHDYLAETHPTAEYSGSDVSPAMVEAASSRLPGTPFEVRDWLLDPPTETWDVVVASGVFNVMAADSEDEWRAFIEAAVSTMFDRCKQAIAFNLMTDQVDFRNPVLYYSDPGAMLDFCRRQLSRRVALRHDYPLYEYTLYVFREPPTR